MKLNPSNIAIIKRLLVGRNNRPMRSLLSRLETADIASLFNSLNISESKLLLTALFSINELDTTLMELPNQQASALLLEMDKELLLKLIVYSPEEHSAHFLSLIENNKQRGKSFVDSILKQLEKPQRSRIQQILSYPEGSAGRIMISQVFCLPSDITVEEGLQTLRSKAQTESIYYIYCVTPSPQKRSQKGLSEKNQKGLLAGIISLRQMATSDSSTILSDIIKKDVITVLPTETTSEVARLVTHYDFIALPVVNETRHLLGVVSIDHVLHIIQDQATSNIYAQAGLQESDRVFSSSFQKLKNRTPWMFLNLFLAALASSVVSLFEGAMNELIILASLKNIVSGMSGNTAIQSLTVVTRGLATGDFEFISFTKSIIKEIISGLSIGLITGIAAGLLTYVWKGNLMVSIVIFISMILNSFIASLLGATTPILLKKMGKDPAIGSGVLVTMMTDIFSFLSFLGIASIGLKYFV